MRNELAQVFNEMEAEWRQPRSGAKEATQSSIDRLKAGETILFIYPFAAPEVVDEIMEQSNAVGQFSLGLFIQPMLHVTKKANRLDPLALKD